ncbi:hypothetical protein D1007_00140 [Hordeum vulgare]|nr:hypothetical protein D1007_00140 [Hordeum vulgare]
MSHLFWNCRGVGNRRIVREVRALVKAHSPRLVFLAETRQPSAKVESLRWKLGLKGFCGVDSDGRGGLALLWDESLTVTVLESCSRFIDVVVLDQGVGKSWRSTFVYGEPRIENRQRMWDHLVRLKNTSALPWVLCGDFNEAMWQHEHFSRTSRAENQMMAFRDALQLCEVVDLGFLGVPYMFDNGQQGQGTVRVRLDRACACEEWRELFPYARVQHLVSPRSDHCPIVLVLDSSEDRRHKGTPKYEIMWERDQKLPEFISQTWATARSGGDLGNVSTSLSSVMTALRIWSKANFGHVEKQIEDLRKELENLQLANADRLLIRMKMQQLDELLYREEMMWLQRSRISWLKEGDRNTKYFHRQAIWRARRNNIRRLQKEDGSWCHSPKEMERMAASYFKELYTKDPTLNPTPVLDTLLPKVSPETNDRLLAPFSDQEILDALF